MTKFTKNTPHDDEDKSNLVKFLGTVFHGKHGDEEVFFSKKTSTNGGYSSTPFADIASGSSTASYTYCTSSVKKNGDEILHRSKSNFAALHVVVLDDVGEKVDENSLPPSYVIETSKGSYHWGYILDEPLRDKDKADSLIAAVFNKKMGLTDSGGAQITKLVKLPIGSNIKADKGGFKNSLVDLNDTRYSVDQLVAAWDLKLGEKASTEFQRSMLPEDDFRKVIDPVFEWLKDRGDVDESSSGNFITITCPWHGMHTTDDFAGYSPVGHGDVYDYRGFKCFHEHCTEQTTATFLEWVKEQGGPAAAIFDPAAPLLSRYVLLEYSNEVADTWAPASALYPIMSLTSFKNSNMQFILAGQRGGKVYYWAMWLESADLQKCQGRIYMPGAGVTVLNDEHGDDSVYFNTYRRIMHMPANGSPDVYLTHIEWLIPDAVERELFHSWIARKLQEPKTRSYAIVLVADMLEGESGAKYGTGRSTVGDILGRVFQSGIAKVSLADISGKGDSQTAFNDWADSTQLCIIEETKEEASSYRLDLASYEGLKDVIDDRPIPNVRVKPKYGKIYTTTVYTNFLFFTNHSDAIQLPYDDRRFAVLDCKKGKRSSDEYDELQQFLRSSQNIANLYEWYMGRDTTGVDFHMPPMTPAKKRMIQQSVGSLDEIWNETIEIFKGGLVTQKLLIVVCQFAVDTDDVIYKRISPMVRAKWSKLAMFSDKGVLKADGKNNTVRIIKNNGQIMKWHKEENFDKLRDELKKNQIIGVKYTQ